MILQSSQRRLKNGADYRPHVQRSNRSMAGRCPDAVCRALTAEAHIHGRNHIHADRPQRAVSAVDCCVAAVSAPRAHAASCRSRIKGAERECGCVVRKPPSRQETRGVQMHGAHLQGRSCVQTALRTRKQAWQEEREHGRFVPRSTGFMKE